MGCARSPNTEVVSAAPISHIETPATQIAKTWGIQAIDLGI